MTLNRSPFQPKILHVITGLGQGGAERMLLRLLEHGRQSWDQRVLTLSPEGELGAIARTIADDVSSLNLSKNRFSPYSILTALRHVRNWGPDVMVTWLYHSDIVGIPLKQICRGVPLVWNIRCADMDMRHYSRTSRLLTKVLPWFSSFPDVVVTNSMAGRLAHSRQGYRPRRWEFIPNGFDCEKFWPDDGCRRHQRATWGVPGDDPCVVGYVGRFDHTKDLWSLLSAYKKATQWHNGLWLVAAGRGIEAGNPALSAMCGELNLPMDRVRLLGSVPDPSSLYPAFDILGLSSRSEGFPNVVGEAMLCGVPVAATDVGDVRLILDGTGMVVGPGDVDGLAIAMASLMEQVNPAKRVEVREKIVSRFQIKNVVERYNDLFKGLL